MGNIKHIHNGREISWEPNVDLPTPDAIIANLKKQGLERAGRRAVLKDGSELRPLDAMPRNQALGERVETKDIPSGTIKGIGVPGIRLFPGNTVKGAEGRRAHYIKTQVASLAEILGERYGQTVQLDRQLRFVMLPHFRLPRCWGMKSTPILIWFPSTYPDIPPHGFYLSQNCRGPHILRYNVYGDLPTCRRMVGIGTAYPLGGGKPGPSL